MWNISRTLILFGLVTFLNQAYGQKVVTLQEALRLSKNQNPDLKVESYNINAAEADIVSSKTPYNPIFNVQTLQIASRSNRVQGTSWSNSQNNQYWYQVTKPFQVASQRKNKISFSKGIAEQTKLDVKEFGRNVLLNTTNKWLDVWAADVNLDILLRGKVYIDSLVIINEVRLHDKVITETDLQRTLLLQQQYQRSITTARQLYVNEIQNLKYLLGTTDSIAIDVNDSTFDSITGQLDTLVNKGLRTRSDIQSAMQSVDVSKLNVNLQKSLAVPQPELGMMYNPQNSIPYIGFYGTINIPIFDRNQGQRQKAEVLKRQAEENLQATLQQAQTEINTAYRTYVVQKKNLADYQGNLTESETILKNIRYAYIKGGTNIIDLLEAQRSWLDTQQGYYNTMLDFRRSYVQLLFATGIINELAE